MRHIYTVTAIANFSEWEKSTRVLAHDEEEARQKGTEKLCKIMGADGWYKDDDWENGDFYVRSGNGITFFRSSRAKHINVTKGRK